MSNALSPGFADPVQDAQSCFRAVLDAMAHPGRLYTIRGISAPPPLCVAAASVLLTLADHETPLWLDATAKQAGTWTAFHTGAPLTELERAVFAIALSLPDLERLPTGTDEMPEMSATVILQVASLTTGRRFLLAGPGLRQPELLMIDGVPADFGSIWKRNHSLYPRGIDLILCVGDQLAALPRSVSVQEA